MKKEFGHSSEGILPDIRKGTKRDGPNAAYVDLTGQRIMDSFLAYRRLVENDTYTMQTDPDTGALIIKDQGGQVKLMLKNGEVFEAEYQQRKAEKEWEMLIPKDSETKDEVGN